MLLDPCLIRATDRVSLRLGHPLLDDYLGLVAARARPNTLLATAWDLKVFFGVVAKDPAEVTTADVLAFITQQRAPRRGAGVVRLEDGEAGLAARTIKRRLASISGCSPTWWCVVTCRPTRCRVGWRHAGQASARSARCR